MILSPLPNTFYFNFRVVEQPQSKKAKVKESSVRSRIFARNFEPDDLWSVSPTQGKYCSIRRMEYPEFQTRIFSRMESALYLHVWNGCKIQISKRFNWALDEHKRKHHTSRSSNHCLAGSLIDCAYTWNILRFKTTIFSILITRGPSASSRTQSFQFKINIGYFTEHGLELSIFQLDFNLRIHTHYISLV